MAIRIYLYLLIAVLSLIPMQVRAEASLTPLRRAMILSRIITYDKGLIGDATTLTIVVLSKSDNATSATEANEMVSAFQTVAAEAKLNGALLKIERLAYADPSAIEASMLKLGAKVVYICEGFDSDFEKIKAITRRRRLLSLSGQDGPVRAGFSVGIYTKEGKSRMIVNLSASQAEGITFPPEFLRLAEIVR